MQSYQIIQASAVSAEDPEITLSKMKKAADDYKSQSTEKAKIRAYREQAMMEGKSYWKNNIKLRMIRILSKTAYLLLCYITLLFHIMWNIE